MQMGRLSDAAGRRFWTHWVLGRLFASVGFSSFRSASSRGVDDDRRGRGCDSLRHRRRSGSRNRPTRSVVVGWEKRVGELGPSQTGLPPIFR